MIGLRNLAMSNLTVINIKRARISSRRAAMGRSEDARVLCWSAGYGLVLAAITFHTLSSIQRREGNKKKGDTRIYDSYEIILKMPMNF